MELFATIMTEAINGLKERKYLRTWLQAAFLFSVVWSFGGILASEERYFRNRKKGKGRQDTPSVSSSY